MSRPVGADFHLSGRLLLTKQHLVFFTLVLLVHLFFLASCCYIHLWSAAKHVDGAFSRLTESAGISRSSLQSSVSDLQVGILSMCADFLTSTSSSSSWFNCASKASSLVCSGTCRNTINKQLRLFISNKLAV